MQRKIQGMNWSEQYPELNREYMLERMLAADSNCDGQFITGVISTGIYCLPSCSARKPKPKNVRFFATPAAAEAAGLRPCLRCKPKDFYRGFDAEEHQLETVLPQLNLAEVRDVSSLARHLQISNSKLHKLFREYLQITPAEWLAQQRIQAAQRLLLSSKQTVAQIAFEVGFESLSAFGDQFRRWSAMTPQAFRQITTGQTFELSLPDDYALTAMLRHLGRDLQQTSYRVIGTSAQIALNLVSSSICVQLDFTQKCVRVKPDHIQLTPPDALSLHQQLWRWLGLQTDSGRFETQIPDQYQHLLAGQRGLRISLIPDLFDGLVWAIIGQQITFQAACTLRRRLLKLINAPLQNGLYAPAQAQQIAQLDLEALKAIGLTQQRAQLLHSVACLAASNQLNLAQLAKGTVPKAERTLLHFSGIGPWTAQYMLLRVFGFQDALPAGDSALQTQLQHFLGLNQRPSAAETKQLMEVFAPYRSLATFHLWQHFAQQQH